MKKLRQFILAAAILGLLLTPSATAAESFSVLLQKGIYAEETEGNLDAAIKIYQQIAAEAAASRSVVAQAQFRLAVCQQKKGNKTQAVSLLNDLLRHFPAEAALGQKARELLATLGQTPAGNITRLPLPPNVGWGMTISLNGRFFAFAPVDDNRADIHDFASGKTWTAVQWAKDEKNTWVTFSPDGRMIAYARAGSFYLAKVDGAEAKQIHDFKGSGSARLVYDWSLDGRSLVVTSLDKDKNISLGVLDIATGNIREIKRWSPSQKQRPESASPTANGRFVAYKDGPEGSDGKINVIDVETGTETTLVEEEVNEMWGWSLAGDQFLFFSSRTGAKGLWAIPVREGKPTGEPELVAANLGSITPLAFTRDGSFYYQGRGTSTNVFVATANFETGEISRQPHRVTVRFQGEQSHPVWSKDGQKLMLAVQGENTQFVAVSMASGEKKDFPIFETFGPNLQQYAWSPDGAALLVQTRRNGESGIHRYDLTSGASETLVWNRDPQTKVWTWNCHPRFTPDGNSFYYTRRDFFKGADERSDWKDSIIRRNLRSGDEEIVYAAPEKLQIWWPYELSPDGDRLAIVASDQFKTEDFVVALKVRSVNGSEARELVRLAPRENLTSLAWTPDGKRLVYIISHPDKNQQWNAEAEVWSVAVDSRKSVKLDLALPDIASLSIHPDGRQIAFRTGRLGTRELRVIEGLLSKPAAPTAGN